MRRKFFLKNLKFFLILLLIPLVILGCFSIQITKMYIKSNLNNDNYIRINQIKENMELIIEELEPLKLSYGIDGGNAYYSKKLLNSQTLGYIDINSLKIINNSLSSLTNAREYIHSIYIYFNNEGEYFLSDNGRKKIGSYYDSGWYQSYLANRHTKTQWSERRVISMPGDNHQEVVSIYNLLSSEDSVIVYNILPRYLEKSIKSGLGNARQDLLIIDNDNEILFGNAALLDDINADTFWGNLENPSMNSFELQLVGQKNKEFIVQKIISSSYGWKYVLFSQKREVFDLYYRLLKMIAAVLVISLIIGITVSVYFTQNSTKQVYNIIDIIQAAEKNLPLPSITSETMSTYGYIVQNIIKTFINQSYLKTQLEARKYKLKSAQLMALQAQINPHFIFNTLETINWKVYQLTQGSNQANDMIEYLSDLIQYSLGPPESEVTLSEEIKNLKNYVYIQKIRYKEKFDIKWECHENALDVKVPRLLLQPLVENAIYHGIKPLESKGCIKVKIKRFQQDVSVCVIDNGLGMTKNELEAIRKRLSCENIFESGSIGLSNINTRAILKFQMGLHINSKKGWGTVVKLNIPVGGKDNV